MMISNWHGVRQSRDEWIWRGFMPRIYDQDMDARFLYKSYFETYVQRDVQQLINIKDQSKFELFVRLLAGRVGQIASLQSLSGEVGVSAVTLNSWLSTLEASYIIFLCRHSSDRLCILTDGGQSRFDVTCYANSVVPCY